MKKTEETKVNNSVLNKASGNVAKGYKTGLGYLTYGTTVLTGLLFKAVKAGGETMAELPTVQEYKGSDKSSVRLGIETSNEIWHSMFDAKDFIKAAKEVEEETKE